MATQWTAARAAGTRKRLVEQPPLGTKWATSMGCGDTVEGGDDESLRISCGMAFLPESGRRFLALWVR